MIKFALVLLCLTSAAFAELKPRGTILPTECGKTDEKTFCLARGGTSSTYIVIHQNKESFFILAKCRPMPGAIERAERCIGWGGVPHPERKSYVIDTEVELSLVSPGGPKVQGTLILNGTEDATAKMERMIHTKSVE